MPRWSAELSSPLLVDKAIRVSQHDHLVIGEDELRASAGFQEQQFVLDCYGKLPGLLCLDRGTHYGKLSSRLGVRMT